jgi:hypothetical protein
MKKLLLIITSIFILFAPVSFAEAWIFSNDSVEIPYCEWDECGLEQWIELIEESWIEWVATTWTGSELLQDILVYVLGFLQLAAVVIIIYAWFNMLTAAWDEDKASNSKKMITFAIIWLAIIYLAGPITTFILDIFTQ